mgnify:CR=1 FL=1
MMKQTIKQVLLSLAAMLFVVSAAAQVTTSSLNGHISDQKGEPVPGATVVAVHTPSGTQYYAVANAEGRFFINGMRAGGPYSVEVSCMGYNTVTYTDVTLQLAEPYALNATLSDDTQMLSEAIVISEAASKFATEKTGAATNITSSQITSLPTVSRSITDVTRLSPYGGNGMTFAGADGRTANFTVDGANFNNNFGLSSNLPGGGNPISIDAIEEMQVVISPYDVRQTNFIGGGVNAITKSGTNKFKASAYMYYYDLNTHGKKALGEKASGIPEEYGRQQYGVTVGGPIIKDKLFFFVSGEYTTSPSTMNNWRPSEDGVADKANFISRTKIEDMQEVKRLLQERYGYDAGSYSSYPATSTNIKALARIDWNITRDHRLALRYNFTQNKYYTGTNGTSSNAAVRPADGFNRLSEYGMAFSNACYNTQNNVHSASLSLNSRIGDRAHNQLLATYTYSADVRGSDSAEFPFIDILYGPDVQNGVISPYISAGYELFTWNNGVKNQTIIVKDEFTYDIGNHHLLAGLSYENQFANNSYMRNGTGYYRYKSLQDFIDEAAPETVALTYGYLNNADPANPTAQVTFNQFGLYLQDDWNISTRFKLNYGVRLDVLAFDSKDIMTNNAIKAVDFGGRHIDTGVWPKPQLITSPRVGFIWDVFGDKSLKVRGGVGLFTGRLPLVYFTNMPTNAQMVQKVGSITTQWKGNVGTPDPLLANFAGPMITDKAALRNRLNELDPATFPLEISPEKGTIDKINGVDPNFRMPLVGKAALGIDYQLPVSFPFTLSAEGTFTKTIHGVRLSNYNIKDAEGWDRLPGADNRLIYPSDYKYTKYDAFVLTNTNQGWGYTANVSMNMRPIPSLGIMASYTRTESKEITGMPGSDATSAFTSLYTVNGPQFATLQRSNYVIPDRLIASVTWNQKWSLEGFDTHISLMYEGRSSNGYSFLYDSDINGDGSGYDLIYIPRTPDEIQFASVDDQRKFWAFVQQDPYLRSHKGQYAEAYSAYTPWTHQIDLRVAQDVGVRWGRQMHKLQFSVDLLNVANLLNSNWGTGYYLDCNSGKILHCTNVDQLSKDVAPVYTYSGGDAGHTFARSKEFGRCWMLQFGVRYLFN